MFLYTIFFSCSFFLCLLLFGSSSPSYYRHRSNVSVCAGRKTNFTTHFIYVYTGQSMRKMGRFIGPIPSKIDTPRLHKIIPFRIFGIYYYHYGMDRLCARYAFVLDSRLPFSFFVVWLLIYTNIWNTLYSWRIECVVTFPLPLSFFHFL